MTKKNDQRTIWDPSRWGLPPEAIASLADGLAGFWVRFRHCFWTKTRDQSAYAYHYLSGLLRMKKKRNFAGIGRATEQSGENIQHFMSNSPWSAQAVYGQVQDEIAATLELRNGRMLLLDESADAKAGTKTAGNGHFGVWRQGNRCIIAQGGCWSV